MALSSNSEIIIRKWNTKTWKNPANSDIAKDDDVTSYISDDHGPVQAPSDNFPAQAATAIPLRRKSWETIASVLILALAAILTVVLLPSKTLSKTASETPTTSRFPAKTPSN
jgi:hypothetical protein